MFLYFRKFLKILFVLLVTEEKRLVKKAISILSPLINEFIDDSYFLIEDSINM